MREARIVVLVLLSVLCCPTRGAASTPHARSSPMLRGATAERSARTEVASIAAMTPDPFPTGGNPAGRIIRSDVTPSHSGLRAARFFHPLAVALTGVVVQRR